jgi:uncharacterized membrane protein YgaE (UPF0421/DUF939 family)
LNELKSLSLILEGMVEPIVMMSVQAIVSRGYASNTFEYICMARLLQMLHKGDFYKNANPLDSNMSTSKEVMDMLRKMEPTEMQALATQVLALLVVKDEDVLNHSADNTKEFLVWLDLFKKSGAND